MCARVRRQIDASPLTGTRRSGRLVVRGSSLRPPLWYRLTGAMNHLIWAAPIPRRLSRWLSFWLYHDPPMRAAHVVAILDALAAADVDTWVSGGWGVDALAGRQTRIHRDLDLILDFADEPRAVDVLASLGYRVHFRVRSDRPTFTRTVLNDALARKIDLHPVDVRSMRAHLDDGSIGPRTVPCLSTAFQFTAHEGYKRRRNDRIDIATLRDLT